MSPDVTIALDQNTRLDAAGTTLSFGFCPPFAPRRTRAESVFIPLELLDCCNPDPTPMSDTDTAIVLTDHAMRLQRVELLMQELRYEITQGVLEGCFQERMVIEFVVPLESPEVDGTLLCRFTTALVERSVG